MLRAAATRLAFRDAFAAVVCGDAIGNITPLGPLVGEPAKAAFVRGRVPLAPALTALAIENVLYTFSAAAMIAAGMIALLFRFSCPASCAGSARWRSRAVVADLCRRRCWLLWRQPAFSAAPLAGLLPGSGARPNASARSRSRSTRLPAAAGRRCFR